MTKFPDFLTGLFIFTHYLVGNVKLFTIESGSINTTQPFFGNNDIRNVTTTVGHTAYLHCDVQQLGDKAVSWIRNRDLHILTVGVLTYTSDLRFQVIRSEKSSNWTLQIKFPQLRDSGIYECQVNTEPKMSLPYKLNVIEAKAKILGSSDLHVREGSSVTLTCTMSQGPHDLSSVFWYKGNKIVENTESNEIQRITIKNSWTDVLTSQLHITRVNSSDSGKYGCVPTAGSPSYANLYVITGEHPAAMHHGNRNCSPTPFLKMNIATTLAIFIFSRLR